MIRDLVKPDINPLREALFVALCLGALILYCISRGDEKYINVRSANSLANRVGLVLIAGFLVTYWRRHILAWWIAAVFFWCYLALGFESLANTRFPWRTASGLSGGWCFIIWPYLKRNYRPYRQFIDKDQGLHRCAMKDSAQARRLKLP
jgi:hypothetical protein